VDVDVVEARLGLLLDLGPVALDQSSPRMCSLRFSPEPTPRKNRPGIMSATVAAAWAMIAGGSAPSGT